MQNPTFIDRHVILMDPIICQGSMDILLTDFYSDEQGTVKKDTVNSLFPKIYHLETLYAFMNDDSLIIYSLQIC